MYHKFAYKL